MTVQGGHFDAGSSGTCSTRQTAGGSWAQAVAGAPAWWPPNWPMIRARVSSRLSMTVTGRCSRTSSSHNVASIGLVAAHSEPHDWIHGPLA